MRPEERQIRFCRYPAIDQHLPSILACFNGLSFFKFVRRGFYQRLGFIYDGHVYFRELASGSGPEGMQYPSVKKAKAFIEATRNQLSKRIAWIDDNHTYVGEVTFPETGKTIRNTFPLPPPNLVELRTKLVEAKAAADAAEPSITGRVKTGPNPEVVQRLVDQLQSLYEDFAETKATALSVGLDGHPSPTDFQRFARSCFVAFGADIPDTLEETIHKKLDRSKSKLLE